MFFIQSSQKLKTKIKKLRLKESKKKSVEDTSPGSTAAPSPMEAVTLPPCAVETKEVLDTAEKVKPSQQGVTGKKKKKAVEKNKNKMEPELEKVYKGLLIEIAEIYFLDDINTFEIHFLLLPATEKRQEREKESCKGEERRKREVSRPGTAAFTRRRNE